MSCLWAWHHSVMTSPDLSPTACSSMDSRALRLLLFSLHCEDIAGGQGLL